VCIGHKALVASVLVVYGNPGNLHKFVKVVVEFFFFVEFFFLWWTDVFRHYTDYPSTCELTCQKFLPENPMNKIGLDLQI